MAAEIIQLRVHNFTACIPHYTGMRGDLGHGQDFALNLNKIISLLNQGARVLLVDGRDSVCQKCLGITSRCHEKQMQKLDHFALHLANKHLEQFGYKLLEMNKIFLPTFGQIVTLRKGFVRNGLRASLREICTHNLENRLENCKYCSGCIRTAEQKFPNVIFRPDAVPG